MEDADFVADSDEDEQEMLEVLALAEERFARQRLEAAAAAAASQEVAAQEPKQEEQEQTVAVVTPEKPLTVEEHPSVQREAQDEAVEEQIEEEEGADEEQEQEQEQEQEEEGVLEVGTLVDVESRTWPGINKLGGAGRIARVYREGAEDGKSEGFFYDVRYVLGGFERHIESKYVHSSELLNRHSNRERVDREYYHDGYINEPHLRKQREAEERRERMMAHPEQAEAQVPHHRKRKRPHRSARVERVVDKPEQDPSQSEDETKKRRQKVFKIDEEMFVLAESNKSSLEVSSRPRSDSEKSTGTVSTAQCPLLKQYGVSLRRRHRILDSSDEESSDDGNKGDNRSESPDRPEHLDPADARSNESLVNGGSVQVSRDTKSADHHRRQRRKTHKTNRRRYIGGYNHHGEDDDALFIQPEGDPADLPEDVIRETGLKLASTKDGLMAQLQEIFAQQQKNMANFHGEQNMVNQQIKNLAGMPLDDLQVLHKKICDLSKFVKKTLINAGEDVMNKIIDNLNAKRGKPPGALERLENNVDNWLRELNECSPWVRNVESAVESAFTRRGEDIPREEAAQAAYSSDSGESSYHTDDYDETVFATEVANVDTNGDPAYDELDFSYDYELERDDALKHLGGQSERASKVKLRGPNVSHTTTPYHPKKAARITTLDDYFSRHGCSNGFRSNLRLVGRQKKILPSDPRWNWVKIARKKQERVGSGIRERSTESSSIRVSNGFGSARGIQEIRSTIVSSRGDSVPVQVQRMHLRDKRFRSQPTQHRSRESFFARSASQTVRSTSQPSGILFDDIIPEKRLRASEPVNPTIYPSSSKQQPINWEAVFEVVSDDPIPSTDGDNIVAISRQEHEALLAFGHQICGPLAPHHLFSDEACEFEDCDSIHDIVTRRVARLRQLVNDLRLQENSFMNSLSRGGLGPVDEEGYAKAPEWILLISLEEAYHTAIASFAAQLLDALEAVSSSSLPNYLQIILEEIATLIRQLPDCDSLFSECKAYFFFFEVASRDAATTPLLTSVSRTYWYSLNLLVAVQSTCGRLVEPHATVKQAVEDVFLKTLPVNRVTLAVVLFLFDLYVYLPSSHRLEDRGRDGSSSGPLPALSLWILVRGCCTSSVGLDQPHQESLFTKEKHFWALLQAVYRQHYFDELARCFVRSESCGGYLRDYAPKTTDGDTTKNCDEIFESQLLALGATWDLLVVLTRIYADAEHEEAVCDAKWAVVKDLLHTDKRDFLPFNLSRSQSTNLQPDYRQRAEVYKQHVLQRIVIFSKLWHPCKEVIEIILRQLWNNDIPHHPDEIIELPQLLKQFITRCKELGNSRSKLAAFAGEVNDDTPDSTTVLCKIIWIQVLKLEKRVHRSRFQRSVLNAIPDTPDNHVSELAQPVSAQIVAKKSGADWNWGPTQHTSVSIQPINQPGATSQRAPTSSGAAKERMSTAVLLTFAVVGVCLECGDEPQFPIQRSDKDVRYMEREVDFYCKEILRRTSRKPECEVLASQALFTLGALLLEKSSTEFPAVFWGLNDRLESSMKNLQTNPLVSPKQSADTTMNAIKARDLDRRRRRFQSAAMASLYQMCDLIKKMLEIPSSGVSVGPAYGPAVEKSLEYVFSAGMEACLNGAIQKIVTLSDLKIAMEIFQLVLPRTPNEPKQCSALEFDDFDYDALANFDLEGALAGRNSTPVPAWTVKECKLKVVQLIISRLRVVLQQLVLNYPPSDAPGFDELYAIDLLGMIISTCEVQFFWSNVTSTSVKPRNLAPRVLSAALKYNTEKEWLGSVFLRESGADQELATAWLLGTLDVSSLNPVPITFKIGNVPFLIGNASLSQATEVIAKSTSCVRYSDSWIMLTDGIIYQMLRKKPVGFCTMDLQILQILREVASTCKFLAAVSVNTDGLHDVAKLYDLHLNVFQSFCRSAGATWRSYTVAPSTNWHEMNQFRAKMVNPQSGIFVSFLDAYKMNFRRACGEIDQMNHNWHSFAELFLRQAGVNATGGRSYHEMDDTIKSFDQRLTGLTTMFRFMYQCMDAFLFYCGEMAIGETNLFLNAMELLFRQVNSAEYPQAIKRLEDQRLLGQRSGVRNVNDDLRKDFCPAAIRFVDSVQLFFARQKYPSLLHWFAQTSEIYQTFKSGWRRSPLRTLLVNILDPDGPLGIHSYYPGEGVSSDSPLDVDVRTVRREAFYLSCGLFNCRCTRSFEHSRTEPALPSCARLQQLREFVLDNFMRETFAFVLQEGVTSLLETMVPLCQFVRGVLNHANLNVNISRVTQVDEPGAECNVGSPARHDFQLSELQSCLEWMVECLINLVPGEEAVDSTISCVLLTELCGIVCEAIAFNEHRPMLKLIDLVELVLSYLQTIYVALSKKTTATIGALFAASVELPLSVKLSAYRFSPSAFRDIVVEERFSQVPGRQMDSYGVNLARAATDLLAAIGRVAQQCKASSDERLQGFTTVSS